MAFLDAGGAFLLIIPIAFIGFLIGIIFLEAKILTRFIKIPFRRALGQSATANIVTTILGWLIIIESHNLGFDYFKEHNEIFFLVLFVITLLVEGVILFVMNIREPKKGIIEATLFMNVASYIILFVLLEVLNLI